jgi:hypothetical protein|tara:strand:+ start:4350 stop:5822 length:1473 start_codon:yes stop_codon:yes gene_type:complete
MHNLKFLFIVLLNTLILSQDLEIPAFGWPVIHQNNLGTKESPHPGPTGAEIQSEQYYLNRPVLMLEGEEFIYYQVSQSPYLYAFDPHNMQAGPVHEVYTGVSFPQLGGGIIDNMNNNWWSIAGRLIRFNSTFSVIDSSSIYGMPTGGQVPPVNGLTLLNGNRILASSVLNYAWLLSTEKDSITNYFPILDTLNFQEFTYNGNHVWQGVNIFSPRPIIDDEGFIYLVGGDCLGKISYNSINNNINTELEWAFINPNSEESDLTLSNPIIVNNNICITSNATGSIYEKVYCLDINTSELQYEFIPFPNAPGVDALHTLGGIQESNHLFIIGNSSNNNAGVAGYDLNTGNELWPFIPLNNISEAFCLSSASNKLYISYSESLTSPFVIASININTGTSLDIYSDPLITALPSGHLGLLGSSGLVYPTPNGIVRLWSEDTIVGDINGDSEVDILDVVMTVNFILSDEYNGVADLNNDGAVNVLDIVQLVSIILD